MFITLKSRKMRSKGEMEQVALKVASTGKAVTTNASTKRRPACVACHNRKLRCTGSMAACDRCKGRRITCIAARKESTPFAETGSNSTGLAASPMESNTVADHARSTPGDGYPSINSPPRPGGASYPESALFVPPGDANSLAVMQEIMEGTGATTFSTPSSATHSNGNTPSDTCSCTQNVVQVLSNIEEDQFKLTQLSLDQVVQLQKWLMYQCCTALECPTCHKQQHVQTILVLICERLLAMYECGASRIAKVSRMQNASSSDESRRAADTYADSYPPQQPGALFDGLTGMPMEQALCSGGIYSSETGPSHSIEEQVCMVHALMKLHIKSFRGLLEWIVGMCEETGNEARRGRVVALEARLGKAEKSLDTSAEMAMNPAEVL